jgi:hypothetical protein
VRLTRVLHSFGDKMRRPTIISSENSPVLEWCRAFAKKNRPNFSGATRLTWTRGGLPHH